MSARKPPTTDEVLDVIYKAERGRLQDGQFRALEWGSAMEYLRIRLRTTNAKAEEWLLALLSEPNTPLAAVRPYIGSFVGAGCSPGSLSRLGWTDVEIHDFRFTAYGSLLLPQAKVRPTINHARAWIVKIEHLEAMRVLLAQAREEMNAKRIAQQNIELASFRHLHGSALRVIQAVVDRMPGETFLRHDVIDARVRNGVGQFYGDDAILTITLRGKQIEAFAAQIVAPDPMPTDER